MSETQPKPTEPDSITINVHLRDVKANVKKTVSFRIPNNDYGNSYIGLVSDFEVGRLAFDRARAVLIYGEEYADFQRHPEVGLIVIDGATVRETGEVRHEQGHWNLD